MNSIEHDHTRAYRPLEMSCADPIDDVPLPSRSLGKAVVKDIVALIIGILVLVGWWVVIP